MEKKQDLIALERKELVNWLRENQIPKFRAKQLFNWIYKHGEKDFSRMKNLPVKLVKWLEEEAEFSRLELKDKQQSEDGTIKYLWELKDGERIESVYLPFESGRNSVCISTQVGCAMGCKFCATGINGLMRNLSPGEIIDQIWQIQKDISQEKFGQPRISNIVFMGMGEPLANLDNLLKAIKIINDQEAFDIGMRRITISTSGLVPQIKKLASLKLQIVLAVSLNAPINILRDRLMPVNKQYPLEELMAAVNYYIQETGRRVSFEYVLLKDINDSPEQALQLAALLKGFLCHVNLIPFNPVNEFDFQRPAKEVINQFQEVLLAKGIEATIRRERGRKIDAACGQLRRLRN